MSQDVGVQVPPSAHINALSSNGRTSAFGAEYCGSNPCRATERFYENKIYCKRVVDSELYLCLFDSR